MTSTNSNKNYFYTKPLEYISKQREWVTAFLVSSSSIFHSSLIPYILMSGNENRRVPCVGSDEASLFSTNFNPNPEKQVRHVSPFSLHLLQSGFAYCQTQPNQEVANEPSEDEESIGFSSTLWKNLAFVTKHEQLDLAQAEREALATNETKVTMQQQHDAIYFEDAETRLLDIFAKSNTLQFASSICVYSLNATEVRSVIFSSLLLKSPPTYFPKTLKAFTYGGTNVGIVLKPLLENCLVLEYLNLSYSDGWPHFFTDYCLRIDQDSASENTNGNDDNDNNITSSSKVEILVAGAHHSLKVLKMDKTVCSIVPHQEKSFFNFLSMFGSLESLVLRHIRTGFSSRIADYLPSSLTYLSISQILQVEPENVRDFLEKISVRCQDLQHMKFKTGFGQFQFEEEVITDESHPDFDRAELEKYEAACASRVEMMKPIGDSFAQHLRTLDLEDCWSLHSDVLIKSLTPSLLQHLTHLNLARCQSLTGAGLKKAFEKSFVRLQYLNLSDCTLVDDDATAFLEEPSNDRHHHHQLLIQSLEYLNLVGTQAGDKTIQRLAPFVNLRFFAITCYSASGLHFQEHIKDESLKNLKNLAKIQTLHFQGWGAAFSDEGLREWLLNCTRLQSLILVDCQGITQKTIETLAERKGKFGVDEDLQELDVQYCDNLHDVSAVRALTGLRCLKCAHADLNLATAAETARALKELKNLRYDKFDHEFENEMCRRSSKREGI